MSVGSAWARFRTAVDEHGRTPEPPAGEHYWLCPTHMTDEDRDLAENIGETFMTEIQRLVEAEDLGSVSDLYGALWNTVGESGQDDAGKGQMWLELWS